MVCDPSANTFNPPTFPPIPGLGGIAISPIQIALPNISIPTDLLEDLLDLVNRFSTIFPSGTFKPNIDNFTQGILDAISNILSQIAPFLSFYNFMMALLNLIMCVIEVLCAIPNPFKIAAAMVKLFRDCLPPFLAMFPFLALILMIIALLLLILALIEYIIATIIAIIEEIIRNLTILGEGVTLQDAESTLAAIQKLANLMCLIQNVMAIFVALGAIMAVIQALAQFSGGLVCDDEDADGTGCCTGDVCPPFIKIGPVAGTEGRLTYHKRVGPDVAAIFANLSLPPGMPSFPADLFDLTIRTERWQLVDTAADQTYSFKDIITPVIGAGFPPTISTFWPEGLSYDLNTPPSKAPYNVDLSFRFNPAPFHPTDTGGTRTFVVTDCVVVRRPYIGMYNYIGILEFVPTNTTGTLNLEGGLVYEEDGYTAYLVDGVQATLNTFIHEDTSLVSTLPATEDGTVISDVTFTMRPVYGTLMGYSLITAGCLPEVSTEKRALNLILTSEDVRSVVQKLTPPPVGARTGLPSTGILPNVSGAQQCVLNALEEFRADVSIASAAVFQASMEACMGDLRDQTNEVFCKAVIAAVSQFKSTIEIDTDLQFISRPITTTVTLRDAGGSNLGLSMPTHCEEEIEDLIQGEVSLGEISDFEYDGVGAFTATITSTVAGTGTVTIIFDDRVLSKFNAGVSATVGSALVASSIEENALSYTFIDTPSEPVVRRGPGDVAGSGGTE